MERTVVMTTSWEVKDDDEARAEQRDEITGGQGAIEASRRAYHPERDQVLL